MRYIALCCMTYLESWYRHDFRYCRCGASFVDGGREYVRYGSVNLKDVVCLGPALPYRLEE